MSNDKKDDQIAVMKKNASNAEALLKQLANSHRLLVLCHLVSGEKTAGNLVKITGLSQSALSQHLAKLRHAGLVEADKRGKIVYYHICSMEAQAILSVLYLIFCNSK